MLGKTLAHYEILSLLGKGGMGEVYRARDGKLDREVALKLLPQEFSSDPERAARFEREARVLASLQHPNIASIYGFEHTENVRFLTMELAEGEDLAQRMDRGPLAIEDLLRIAEQIAVGLEAAHQKGIIHRDLKPANVKVDHSGNVKILDFGLARAYTGDASESEDLANSPTISAAMTQAGMILGTAAYMSPEQAKGKAVDQRSDIWSYGVLVFEMLSGKKLFAGETVSETMAEVMKSEIDWKLLPGDTPDWLTRLLRRCLDRNPQTRLQSIGEARIAIERGDADDTALATAVPETSKSTRWPWIAISATLLVLAAAVSWYALREEAPAPLVQSTILPPEGWYFTAESPFAVSPDGGRIAFVVSSLANERVNLAAKRALWVRDLSESEAREVPGTEGAQYPFWSHDARMLGFFANGKLNKVDLRGGPVLPLCDTQDGRGGSWNAEGTIVFQRNWSEGLMKIPAGGGTPEPVTTLDRERSDVAHRWPQFLPDGRRFLFFVVNTTSLASSQYSGVYLGSLDSDETTMILRGESRARYSEGHLLYRVSSTLMARAVDTSSLEFLGDEIPVATDIPGGGISWGGAHFGVSDNGLLVHLRGAGATNSLLVWRDREGNQLGTIGEEGKYGEMHLSHDGKHLAVSEGAPTADIWLHDLERGVRTRFTFDPADDRTPVWSPQDDRIAFTSSREAVGGIYERPVSGQGAATLLHTAGTSIILTDWSPDGRWILYSSLSLGDNVTDIMAYDTVEKVAVPIVEGPFAQRLGTVSPDGRWLAFTSVESGRSEVYVQPFPEGTGRWMASTDGGTRPRWSRNGMELIFADGTGEDLYAVEFSAEESPSFSAPRRLFSNPIRSGMGIMNEVTSDGERFLANELPEMERTNRTANLIQNWTRILER